MNINQAQLSLDTLKSVDIKFFPSEALIKSALDIAYRINQAVYDCVYLTLAINHQCLMVTADKRFVNSIQNDVVFSYVCWIENL